MYRAGRVWQYNIMLLYTMRRLDRTPLSVTIIIYCILILCTELYCFVLLCAGWSTRGGFCSRGGNTRPKYNKYRRRRRLKNNAQTRARPKHIGSTHMYVCMSLPYCRHRRHDWPMASNSADQYLVKIQFSLTNDGVNRKCVCVVGQLLGNFH